jgi:PEP-CTERM motif-containing protein
MKMKNTRLMYVLVAVLLIIGLPTSGSAVLIGFEDFPVDGTTGPVVTNQYPSVTFSSDPGFSNYVSTQPGIGFGNNFLCTGPNGGSINCTAQTTLTFTSPVNSLQFWEVGSNSLGTVAQVDVFVSGSLTATENIPGTAQFNTPSLVDLSAFSNVTSIKIYNITDAGGLGWDNFSFNTTASIPEPATLLLLGLGLIGVAGVRRKFKK